MTKYDSLKLKHQLCFPLYAAAREITKQYRPYLDEIDLTYTQYIAMMVFWEEKQLSVKELGQRLYLDSGTLTPMLKNLESKGYISRQRSKDDERVLEVKITEQGEKLKKKAAMIPEKMRNCTKLNDEESILLYQLLYKILNV